MDMDKRVTRDWGDKPAKVTIENPTGTKQISFDAPAKRIDLKTIQTGLNLTSNIAIKNKETGIVTTMKDGTVYFENVPLGNYVTCSPPHLYKMKKSSVICIIS
jgi:hypothetical protein